MRTHQKIVQDFGASALARALDGLGVHVHQSTPQRWAERNSIPGEYWNAIAQLGGATLEELADAAEAKRKVDAAPQSGASA